MDISNHHAKEFAIRNGCHNLIADIGVCMINSDDDTPPNVGLVLRMHRQNEPHAEWDLYYVTDVLTAYELGKRLLTYAEKELSVPK